MRKFYFSHTFHQIGTKITRNNSIYTILSRQLFPSRDFSGVKVGCHKYICVPRVACSLPLNQNSHSYTTIARGKIIFVNNDRKYKRGVNLGCRSIRSVLSYLFVKPKLWYRFVRTVFTKVFEKEVAWNKKKKY